MNSAPSSRDFLSFSDSESDSDSYDKSIFDISSNDNEIPGLLALRSMSIPVEWNQEGDDVDPLPLFGLTSTSVLPNKNGIGLSLYEEFLTIDPPDCRTIGGTVFTLLCTRDIICGRSTKQTELHQGNKWFRETLIAQYKKAYNDTPCRVEKQAITNEIMLKVLSEGGRFVEKKVQLPDGRTLPWSIKKCPLELPGAMIVYVLSSRRVYEEKIRKALRRDEQKERERNGGGRRRRGAPSGPRRKKRAKR